MSAHTRKMLSVFYGNGIYGRHRTFRTTLRTFSVPFCFMEMEFAEACGGFGQFCMYKNRIDFWSESMILVVQIREFCLSWYIRMA